MTAATIRDATATDVPRIVEMGGAFFQEAGWAEFVTWDDASITATLGNLITADSGILVVSECDGALTGMVGGMVFPAYFNVHCKIGQELFLWVCPDARDGAGSALLDACEARARAAGAVAWAQICLESHRPAATQRSYRSRGYRAVERMSIKRL